MFIMITLGQVHNMTHEILTKLTKMLWMFVKQFKLGNMKPKYTHKSGGKVSKNIVLVVHVCFFLPTNASTDYYLW